MKTQTRIGDFDVSKSKSILQKRLIQIQTTHFKKNLKRLKLFRLEEHHKINKANSPGCLKAMWIVSVNGVMAQRRR